MATYVKTGDPIRLNLELFDGATNKFVRAFLFDSAGDPLFSNPTKDLTHVGEGLYMNNQVIMPDLPEIKVVYVVYNDSGHTQISRKHSNAIDIFEQTPFTQGQIIIVNESQIVGTITEGDTVEGTMEEIQLISGDLSSDQATVGTLDEAQNLTGVLEDEQELAPGAVQDGQLQGSITDCT